MRTAIPAEIAPARAFVPMLTRCRVQLRHALSVDVFRPRDAHATQAVVSAVLAFAHASRQQEASDAAHSGELPGVRGAFSAGGSAREQALTGSGGGCGDDRAAFSPLRGHPAAFPRQSGSSPSLGSLLHAHAGSPLAPRLHGGAGLATTPVAPKRPPGLQLPASLPIHASPVSPLDPAALRSPQPGRQVVPPLQHGAYTLAGVAGANAAALFGGAQAAALLEPASSPRSVGGARARTPALGAAAGLLPADAAQQAPPAPPYWPADTPRDVGRCASEFGGWPGSAPEEGHTFNAALHRFWKDRAAAAAEAAAMCASPPGGPFGNAGASPPCASPPRIPVVGSATLDVAALYREVCSRGGCAAVTTARAWRAVATALRLPSSLTSAASTLRGHYEALLGDYEAAHFSAPRARAAGALLPGGRDEDDEDACTESGLSARCGGSASASVGGTATSAGGLARQGHLGVAGLPVAGSGRFTEAEDAAILRLRHTYGNKWKALAEHLPGRSHASIKKHWHTTLKHKYEAAAAAGASSGEMMQQPAPAAAAHALSAQLGVTALGGGGGSPGKLLHPVPQRLSPDAAAAAAHVQVMLASGAHQNYFAAMAQQQQHQLALAHYVAAGGGGGEVGADLGGAYGYDGLGGMQIQSPGAGGYAGIPLIQMPAGGVFMPSGPQPPRGANRFSAPSFLQGDAAAHAALLGQQAQAQLMYPTLAAMNAAQGFGGGGGYLQPGGPGSH